MTALTGVSDLVNRATAGNSGTPESVWFFKQPRVNSVAAPASIAAKWSSLWMYEGYPVSANTIQSACTILDNTTNGGLEQTDPGGGRQKWLTSMWACGLSAGTLLLYDRLLERGNMSPTGAGTDVAIQGTSPSPTLTRYTDGIGNIAWYEVVSLFSGTGAATLQMSYVNQDGSNVTASPQIALGGTGRMELGRVCPLPLSSGDYGIQAVRTFTWTAASVNGTFGCVIGHPLAFISIGTPGGAGWRDYSTGLPGLPEIQTDACLAFLWLPISTGIPELFGSISMIEA